jgi:hypothetical protein
MPSKGNSTHSTPVLHHKNHGQSTVEQSKRIPKYQNISLPKRIQTRNVHIGQHQQNHNLYF